MPRGIGFVIVRQFVRLSLLGEGIQLEYGTILLLDMF